MPQSTWEHPAYPRISEERDGRLFTPGRKLARTTNGAIAGRGTITSLTCS